ncbi:THO complex subunit 2 [Seminavis robusta]|uniref:THO complex subunit 2 n=1 Tax=Seminavis robusta TaxID=568900 RepID=A0A9N8D790_9STRA|nr:THO complex subunit 2 [Seminavis robusta]|eukprot:Sro19_g013450.1 THO complex subunit 2 (1512) ;mRNA; f:79663-84531
MSLPSKDDIRSAFVAGKIPVGRQLLWQALQVGVTSEESSTSVANTLSELLFQKPTDDNDPDLEEHLVDAFWLASSSIVDEEEKKDAVKGGEEKGAVNGGNAVAGPSSRDSLAKILKSILSSSEEGEDAAIVSKKNSLKIHLQSHLDPVLLEKSGLVNSEKDLMKKLRMLNTRNYRQHKFNLLQEESEGFSKVLEALVKHDFSALKGIIGTFHVDPNRILDLALDVVIEETNSHKKKEPMELGWLKEVSIDKIPALMAFKLKHTAADPNQTQRILQTIASLCIREPGILPVAKMSLYLEPITTPLGQTFPLFSQIERKRVRSVGKVSLGGSSASKKKEEERDAQNQAKLADLLKQLEQTHRIQLLNMLLKERQWKLVQVLFPNRDELKQILTLYQPLGSAVCDWIHAELIPLCDKYCQKPPSDLVKPLSTTLPAKKKEESTTTSTKDGNSDEEATAESVVEKVSGPLLCILDSGCIVARPTLYCQLCRLLRALLTRDGSSEEGNLSPSTTLYSFIESFLLPSLSLFPASPSLSLEVWSILKLFPYTTRYQLYRDWRGVGLEKAGLQLFGDKKKPLVLVESEMHAGKDARYVLKRLSKDTIREACRQIGKVTHSSPLVMFTTVLNQIESYDNLVTVMVDALQFVTPLGLDVLGFCMLSRLCGSANNEGDRSRSKEGGINVALWLQSMESFIGSFYERYPFVEFRGIVCYVMRRLKSGHVTELGVLRSLLKTTGGWSFADYSPAASLSLAQLEGRAGSTLLKRETMTFGVVDKFNLRASRQLRFVLQSEDIGVSLLILLAQVRSKIVFEDGGGRPKPVKLIGSLFDTTQVVITTLLDFMTKSSELAQPLGGSKKSDGENGKEKTTTEKMPSDEIMQFATSLPKLTELVKVYGIDMATAWMLCRPLVRAAEKDEYANATDTSAVLSFAMTEETRESYKSLVHKESTWDNISQDFFEIFFVHTLYDLLCPENIYNAEITRVTREIERLSQRKNQVGGGISLQPGSVGGGRQENPMEEIERLKNVSSTLSSQISEQKERVALIQEKMKGAAAGFFPKKDVSVSAVNTFLSQCIFPRSMQGPDDAMYCAQFVSLLHKGETPGFSTLHYLDELVSVLSSSLFGVTEGEAANLSILLLETWKMVCRWRYDEKAFEDEVAGKPGSYMVDPVEEGGTTSEGNLYPVTFEQYRLRFERWHMAIGAAALGCLQSSEYMHTRASLIVLSRIVEVFPTRPNLGNKLFEVLEPLKSDGNSALPDIRSAAQAYFMQLTKARADGVWKEEDAAMVQARVKAEKAAQELRKRKAQELFDDMKMESEKINAEIGGDDRRDRFGGRDRRGRPSDSRDYGRGGSGPDGRRSPALNANAPNFEPPPRRTGTGEVPARDRGGDRRSGGTSREADRRRDGDTRGGRDSAPLLGSLGRAETHSAPARGPAADSAGRRNDEEEPRGLEGRWEGSRNPGGGGRSRAKRGRSPSPDGDRGESRGGRSDRQPSKRSRTESGVDGHRSPDHGRSGGGGRRRR